MTTEPPLFPALTDEEIAFIAAHGVVRRFPKGAVVINEGDEGDFMFVLREGRVKVFASDGAGREVLLNIQGPGSLLGELALIDETPRSASVMALEPVTLVLITRRAFEDALRERPDLALRFLSVLTKRVRYLTHIVKNLACRNVTGRIAFTLDRLAEPLPDGRRRVSVPLTQRDLAEMVGASREMVGRVLKEFERDGLLTHEGRHYVLSPDFPPRR